jgi:hypothetical protein
VLSMFAGFGFEWPTAIKAIFNALSVLNFNLDMVAPECSVTITFETKWCVVLQAWCASLCVWLAEYGPPEFRILSRDLPELCLLPSPMPPPLPIPTTASAYC